MNKLNGQLLSYYGFVLIKYKGILDMPGRLGETVYDWGNYSEPLVHQYEIFWKGRDIRMDVLFDQRRTSKTLSQTLTELEGLNEFLLESDYGNYIVKLKEAENILSSYFVTKLTVVLQEKIPVFNAVPKTAIGGTGIVIDGFDLWKDFGIKVSKISSWDYLPGLKGVNTTIFNTSKKISNHRDLKILEFECSMPFKSISQMNETIERLKKLLSQDGFRVLNLKSQYYNAFFTKGFAVSIFKNHVKFNLQFNLIQSFVDNDFIDFGFVN